MNNYEELHKRNGMNNGRRRCFCSVRVLVAALSMLGTAIMYITRVNLNIAILAMVNTNQLTDPLAVALTTPINSTQSFDPLLMSVDANSTDMINNNINHRFDWSPPEVGIILGSFFYGYTVTQVIGGRLSESYVSPTKLIFIALSSSGVINLATPFLARISLTVFVISRIVLGAAQGLVYPAFYCLFSKWIPDNERSFLALVWSLFWLTLVTSEPEDHPLISSNELELIVTSRQNEADFQSFEPNWKAILTSSVFYAVLASKICYGIVFDFVTLKIPAYLQDVIQMPVDENGLALALIMTGYMLTLLACGPVADGLLSYGTMSKCQVRKLFQFLSGAIMSSTLLLVPFVGSNKYLNVLLLTLCMFGYGFTSGGDVPIVADIGGPLSGTVFALMNTLCSISGFAVPYVVGVVIESMPSSFILWSSLINTCAILVILGTIWFMFFASCKPQSSWSKQQNSNIIANKPLIEVNDEEMGSFTDGNDDDKRLHSNTDYKTFPI
ncbi:hypothetical protein RDWZM_001154 [Blomia tropicalis]|uniref:Uncharacterized protein n=1 Tax=Blomia tropicalis TaxID=40697 RepID=A0A9Q0RQA2_BLOTA|nr:hypothetical protein RDWZM_001154 [Blomia tropicalis]